MAWLDNQVRSDRGILEPRTGLFFKNKLEYTMRRALSMNLPAPNLFRYFMINDEVAEGATSYSQEIQEAVGRAIVISDYGADLPRVNVTKSKVSRGIVDIGDAYSYTYKQIKAAQFAGEPLDTTLGGAAREVTERKHNELGWWGDDEHDLFGVLNHPHIPRYLFGAPLLDGTTPKVIMNMLNAYLDSVNTLTETAAQADTLLLPPDEYMYIKNTMIGDGSEKTILEWLLSKREELRTVGQCWELAPKYNNGQALCVAFRNNELVATYVAPQMFRQMPVQRNNLEWVVDCVGTSGGFYSRRPLEMVIGELKRA